MLMEWVFLLSHVTVMEVKFASGRKFADKVLETFFFFCSSQLISSFSLQC